MAKSPTERQRELRDRRAARLWAADRMEDALNEIGALLADRESALAEQVKEIVRKGLG